MQVHSHRHRKDACNAVLPSMPLWIGELTSNEFLIEKCYQHAKDSHCFGFWVDIPMVSFIDEMIFLYLMLHGFHGVHTHHVCVCWREEHRLNDLSSPAIPRINVWHDLGKPRPVYIPITITCIFVSVKTMQLLLVIWSAHNVYESTNRIFPTNFCPWGL